MSHSIGTETGTIIAAPSRPEARARGITVSVDAGSAAWLVGNTVDFLARLLATQICFANAQEAALLWPDRVPSLPDGVVVVTRGRAGASAYQRGNQIDVAAPQVPLINSLGAGDGFAAGFLAARLHSRDLGPCLAGGVALAARALATSGGRPIVAQR